jgi:hypothetical protein
MTDHDGDGRYTRRPSGPATAAVAGTWRDQFGDVADGSHHLVDYVEDEQSSTLIRSFEPKRFPGLLQLPATVHAMAEIYQPQQSESERAQFVRARLGRAELLRRSDAPRLSVLVSEDALHDEWGSPAARLAQLDALADELDGGRSNVDVHIVPAVEELPDGPSLDAFVVMSLRDGRDVLWREADDHSERVVVQAEVEQAVRSFERLEQVAYELDEARDAIKRVRKSLG